MKNTLILSKKKSNIKNEIKIDYLLTAKAKFKRYFSSKRKI